MSPSWGSFSVMLAPFSAQVGPGTVFEPSYLRKNCFSRNRLKYSVSDIFSPNMAPQNDPRIAPRRVQARLGLLFLSLDFSFRSLIVLGSVLVPFWPPKWSPRGAHELGKSAPGRSKTVLGSSWFGPFFVLRFGIAFLSLLGASWSRFRVLLGSFWVILGALGFVFGHSGWHSEVL